MHVASVTQSERRTTLETAIELINAAVRAQNDADVDDAWDPRSVLIAAEFSRADSASEASIQRLTSRIDELIPLFSGLPDLELATATSWTNEELTELPITPSIADHGGSGPHLHWTPNTARFDDQVMSDILMALAQELCDNGTIRFGRCDASDCADLFYDGTRNRSKRFCADPRCASRTHTADHRARNKSD